MRRAETVAKAAADARRGAKPKTLTAAGLVGDGFELHGYSAGDVARINHPKVHTILDQLEDTENKGGCAEIDIINQALHRGLPV